jgi:HD superfamily phosphodiesterase
MNYSVKNEKEILLKTRVYSNKYYDKCKFCDFLKEHIDFVLKYAVKLAKIEKADVFVVSLSAILHDIGKDLGREGHSKRSFDLAKVFLFNFDIEKTRKDLILKCILKHSSKYANEDNEMEVKILQSADALGVLFDKKWQKICRDKYDRDELVKLYDKTYNKINLDSAKKIAKSQIEYLKNLI